MQVVYHLGVHGTDEERLIRCLLRNRATLGGAGVAVPAPGRYRKFLRETVVALRGEMASAETQEMVLDAVNDGERPERIVFSHEFFLGIPHRAIENGQFYPSAARQTARLANLFPDDAVEFHLALCNPATLVPALISRIEGASYASVLGEADPMSLRWAEVIARIREAVPDARIVVWCNEDTPLIWPEVLRSLAGRPDWGPLEGEEDFLRALMTEGGFARMHDYLARTPPRSVAERRAVTAAFLGKYARPGTMEQELALPGWTTGLVEALTAAYDADVQEIAGLPGVEVILP